MQRFSIHDGPGIRTTVFLEGCPLRCAWCQNPEAFEASAPALSAKEVIAEVVKDRPYYQTSGGGLTLSGGEPLLRAGPARALLEEAGREGVHACVQTSGAVPWSNFEAVLPLVGLFQFDLKHLDPRRHQQLTGAGTAAIHANAARLLEAGAQVQFRMPLVPGLNDEPENLARLASFLTAHGQREVRLVPYHRLYEDKYARRGLPPPLPECDSAQPGDLKRAADQLADLGVNATADG